jgi:hypothetical protein
VEQSLGTVAPAGDDVELSDLAGGGGPVPGPPGRLAAGTALAGGRLHVAQLIGRTAFGEVYRAQDRASGQAVALRLVDEALARDQGLPGRLHQVVTGLGKIEHKNLTHVIESGAEAGLVWLVTELVDGENLRTLLARKRAGGSPAFSIKGAYNIIAHVCNGLAAAHAVTWHGGLSAQNVLVNKAGRVKITELGLARAMPAFVRLQGADLASIAPEVVKGGQGADARADVFSIGALLYELLVGQPPVGNLVRPSGVTPGTPAEIDPLIARCLSPGPGERFPDIQQLKAALAVVVEKGGAAAAPAPRVSAPRPAFVPAATPAAAISRSHAAAFDDAEEKWLVTKGKLDFGPFSFKTIKEQIQADQIEPGHVIIDNENGQRCKVEDHPLLHDLVMAAAQRRDDLRRANAEAVVVQSDKRKGTTLYAFIAVGVLAVGGGGYYLLKALGVGESKEHRAELGELSGADVATTIKLLDQPKRPPRDPNKKAVRRTGGGSPSGGGFDEALDLGDASEGDEGETLSNSQINPVIQSVGGRLGRCLGGGVRTADIELIIKGDGRVSAVRVNGSESSGVARCVKGVMSGARFPSFKGTRTRASFSMSI